MTEVETLAARLAEALDEGQPLAPDSERRLFAALVRRYALGHREPSEPPFAEGTVPAEAVALTAAAMLRAGEVTSFELAALFNV